MFQGYPWNVKLVTMEIIFFGTVQIISLKNSGMLIGGQIIVQDLLFSHKIPRMNICTSV